MAGDRRRLAERVAAIRAQMTANDADDDPDTDTR